MFASAAVAVVVGTAGALFPGAAFGAAGPQKAEVSVIAHAWYWEDQSQQKVTDPTSGADVAVIELTNPYCPQTAASTPEQTCKPGRLPIEVRGGDYKTPNKLSAVTFDLTAVPLGSRVVEFTATFFEADDPQSQSRTPEGRKIQACVVSEIFGEGEARLYKEIPKFRCTAADPIGKRKRVEAKDEERFVWTFDLTRFARRWVDEAAVATSILLHPKEPKKPGTPAQEDWLVVLAGPRDDANAISTRIRYVPPRVAPPPPPDDGGTTVITGTPSTSVGGGGFTGFTPPAPGPGMEEVTVPDVATPTTPVDTAAPTGDTTPSTPAEALPSYVYLAILAGLGAFGMLRSAVVERTTGIRPDGVLARIHRINAARRGATVAEAGVAPAPGGRAPTNLWARLPAMLRVPRPFRRR